LDKKYPFGSLANGLTVAELVVTMALLAIVSAIAYPNFHSMADNSNIKTAARDLVADFNALRARAMAECTPFSITFDLTNNRYSFPGLGGGKSPADISRDIIITQAVFGPGTTVNFTTRGALSPPGTVVLANRRGSTAAIISNLSGRIHVQFNMH
jgi:prepilin-type N-terminal cleavage/methylation domain-containing protein